METKNELVELTGAKKANALLQSERLTPGDVAGLDNHDRQCFEAAISGRLRELKGIDRDMFISKIEQVLTDDTKNRLWEYNHELITNAIAKLSGQYGRMPSKSALAAETGLSRQTIVKHIKEYKSRPGHKEEMEQFEFMVPKVLANVFGFAVKGDIRAAKLYFEMTGALNKQQAGTVINEQNNYLQINNTILSQENLKQLSDEQLRQIENIINSALPAAITKANG